ncbi:predicted protein [Streptomyces viridochromogenes DSM 40736]|uniref:Predicted protein n=1 Tax=Streptomyces viridochromogenes (strain DSM 40736 / JCM 4977 / BCRC 1201 / Tue 494) TaxID=591159 RepID=D9XII5_STRVT|nr:predicted protein [Streptomyces viridochromogenes DSM 40736]
MWFGGCGFRCGWSRSSPRPFGLVCVVRRVRVVCGCSRSSPRPYGGVGPRAVVPLGRHGWARAAPCSAGLRARPGSA